MIHSQCMNHAVPHEKKLLKSLSLTTVFGSLAWNEVSEDSSAFIDERSREGLAYPQDVHEFRGLKMVLEKLEISAIYLAIEREGFLVILCCREASHDVAIFVISMR